MRLRLSLTTLLVSTLVGSSFVSFPSPADASIPTSHLVQVWVEPLAGFGFLDEAILSAKHDIDVSMYELSDPVFERDLVARALAGVQVHVLLNADYEGKSENMAAYNFLRAGGVHVAWASSSQIFHAKYVVIDKVRAYIGTGNLVAHYYSSTRDFWVLDSQPIDVTAIDDTFLSDFTHHSSNRQGPGGLVWSPGSKSSLVALINSATTSLFVENEEMNSSPIEHALEAASKRGVRVEVVMTSDSQWTTALEELANVGVHVRTLNSSQVYIHAKVLCVDCTNARGTAFVGSENFSTSSLNYNRELGVITTSRNVVSVIGATVQHDFASGAALPHSS
jgi:phosphatidylserine/phosphatidylglycerophosphate/cardiolipin synthase-like enzyme